MSIEKVTLYLAVLNEKEMDELKRAEAFKQYVHDRLDKMGVPHEVPGTHTDAGCRVGGRLDWIESQLRELECRRAAVHFRVDVRDALGVRPLEEWQQRKEPYMGWKSIRIEVAEEHIVGWWGSKQFGPVPVTLLHHHLLEAMHNAIVPASPAKVD